MYFVNKNTSFQTRKKKKFILEQPFKSPLLKIVHKSIILRKYLTTLCTNIKLKYNQFEN